MNENITLRKKMHLKISSVEVVSCMLMLMSRTNFGIHTNSVDPDQTAPRGVVLSEFTQFATETF